MTVLRSSHLVLPSGNVDGQLEIRDGIIAGVGPALSDVDIDLGDSWVVPGFVDLHMHGGGGASVTTGDPDEALRAVELHRAHGTTTTLASLVTAPVDDLVRGASALADLADDGHIAGIHFEGPFLSAPRCGAQDPRYLLDPDPAVWATLLAATRGHAKAITIAPELPGAIELIRRIVDSGVVAAIGHTDATYDQTLAGIDAGATLATHLFNGMRGLHHREPGPITALIEHPDMVVELIADGVHLHDAVTSMVFHHAGGSRVALVTDAMSAAGAADGVYPLGPQTVTVRNGVALLDSNGSIAGSTLTLDRALQRTVNSGVSIQDAVRALTETPARVLGIADRVGSLASGFAADLVVLDKDLVITAIMAGGEWRQKPF